LTRKNICNFKKMEFIDDKRQWNDLVLKNNGSFLQSWEWGELQKKLGRKIRRAVTAGMPALILRYKLPLNLFYFYCPGGPLISKIKNPDWKLFAGEIKKNLSDQKSIFLKIEPWVQNLDENALKKAGFVKSTPLQPEMVRVLNLKKNQQEIYSKMEHDTRYSIRTAEKRGVKVINVGEPEEKDKLFGEFWRIFYETNVRRDLKFHSQEYYREVSRLNGDCRSELFLAQIDNKTISGAIVVYFGNAAYYLYAASAAGYGKYNAPTFTLWNVILRAQSKGCEILDMGGISHTKKSWAGITAFKKTFGGEEIIYPGAWNLPLKNFWYIIYCSAKKILK